MTSKNFGWNLWDFFPKDNGILTFSLNSSVDTNPSSLTVDSPPFASSNYPEQQQHQSSNDLPYVGFNCLCMKGWP